jgi:polyphosphate kinase
MPGPVHTPEIVETGSLLHDPALYLEREPSLLAFQRRVLEEAQDGDNPLLERVKFLSILFSNLDEFFMVRVAALKQRLASSASDGIPEQLERICAEVKSIADDAYATWRGLLAELQQAGIELPEYSELTERERGAADAYFRQVVYPVLTPLAFDPGRPFPHISNLSLNLAVAVRDAKGVEHFARLKIPDTLPQLVSVADPNTPANPRPPLIWLEQLVAANLHVLFPGLEIIESYPFRVTRDAEVAIQELESDDLLETVEEAVWQRRFRAVVRLQVSRSIPQHMLDTLVENLELPARRLPRGWASGPRTPAPTGGAGSSGPERRAVSSLHSRRTEIRGRHFRSPPSRRLVAAPSLRIVPARSGVPAPRRGRSGRNGDQDDAVSRGPQFAGRREPAERHREWQAGGRHGGAESPLR